MKGLRGGERRGEEKGEKEGRGRQIGQVESSEVEEVGWGSVWCQVSGRRGGEDGGV